MTTTKITHKGKKLVVTAFVSMIAAYNLWPLFGVKFYDAGMAFGILCLVWSIHLSANDKFRIFSLAFLLLCFSNFFDELFFDPTHAGINEYISALLIIVTVIVVYLKDVRRNKGHN
jgi:hypothetical protein